MDISRDEFHRQIRDLEAEHREVMPRWRSALMRLLVDDTGITASDKGAVLLGGFNRRRFLQLGGAAAAGGVLLAACGDDDEGTTDATGATTGENGEKAEAGGDSSPDVTVARTAASLEIFAVNVYDTAIQNAEALGISAPVGTAAQVFRDQHDEHAKAFNAAAEQLGGEPYTQANPTAQETFADRIAALKTEADVLRFALDLEQVAAQTYQGVGVSLLSTPMLRQTAMSVGGVEARHAAILAGLVEGATPANNAFQPTDQAVTQEFFV